MRALLGLGLLIVMGAATAADDKIDAKKLVGKWEINDVKKDVKGTVEFTKDQKLIYVLNLKGKDLKMDGTYKLEGSKLSVTLKIMDTDTTKEMTVKKLTDAELTVEDEKGEAKTLKKAK